MSQPAHADWTFTQEGNDTQSFQNRAPYTANWVSPGAPLQAFQTTAIDGTTQNAATAAKTNGPITLICKWTPDPENSQDKLPAVFYIRVASQVTASSYGNFDANSQSTITATPTLDNGLEGPNGQMAPVQGPSINYQSYGFGYSFSTRWQMSGAKFFQFWQLFVIQATASTTFLNLVLTWQSDKPADR